MCRNRRENTEHIGDPAGGLSVNVWGAQPKLELLEWSAQCSRRKRIGWKTKLKLAPSMEQYIENG